MFAKNFHLHWIAGRANVLSKYIVNIFLNFRRGFCGSFPSLFPKASASCCKKILFYLAAKNILFQTGDINIFVLRGAFFKRKIPSLKVLQSYS